MKWNWVMFLLIAELIFFACNQKERNQIISNDVQEKASVAMDSFHLTLSEAFHPYKDSANLEPVRRLKDELAREAEVLSSVSLPDIVNRDTIKEELKRLISDTRQLSELINRNASEEEIGTALETLHTRFHTIMEAFGNDEY